MIFLSSLQIMASSPVLRCYLWSPPHLICSVCGAFSHLAESLLMYSVWPNFARVPGVVRQQLQIRSMSSYNLVMNLSISTVPNQLAYLLRKVGKELSLASWVYETSPYNNIQPQSIRLISPYLLLPWSIPPEHVACIRVSSLVCICHVWCCEVFHLEQIGFYRELCNFARDLHCPDMFPETFHCMGALFRHLDGQPSPRVRNCYP